MQNRIRTQATFRLHGPLSLMTPLALCAALAAQHWRGMGPPAARLMHSLAFDLGRGCTVLFGGYPARSDTWEFGVSWRKVLTTTSPPARSDHALAYDTRGRIVLHGGFAGMTILADTWEYDGTNWSQVVTAQSPGVRAAHAMAFDMARNRTVLFGGATDTWEYDGTNWTQRSTVNSPTSRVYHGMAFDLVRARVVLHGGWGSGATFLRDTWEYDGANWTAVVTQASPPARSDSALAYDILRNRTVLFGSGTDTWEYDGSNWVQVSTPASPPALEQHAIAYDAARGRTVLHGGGDSGTNEMSGDTWTYDGSTWTLASVAPPDLFGAAVAHDSLRGRTILFGGALPLLPWMGCAGSCPFLARADTWESDGSTWRRAGPVTSPPARAGGAASYDSRRRRTVLFGGRVAGGRGGGGYFPNDTWEYDGTTWSQVNTAVAPPSTGNRVMSFDPARGRMVLFGGNVSDTWEYDGVNWMQVATAAAPLARTGHAMAFALARQRTVLFGGVDAASNHFADTWEYDGSNWAHLATPVAPPARTGHAMTWDPVRGCVVLAGGSDFNLPVDYADTWTLVGNVWTRSAAVSPAAGYGSAMTFDPDRGRPIVFDGGLAELVEAATPTWARHGRGCAGSAGTPSLDATATPGLGSLLPLQLTMLPGAPGGLVLAFGLGIARWNGMALPADLGPFGLPGCELWVEPASSLLITHPGTARTFPLAIPANPLLSGLLVSVQALVFDAAAANGTGPLTNAGVMRLY